MHSTSMQLGRLRAARASLHTSVRAAAARPPLFHLENAAIPHAKSVGRKPAQGLSWTIEDLGKDQCWAVIGPSGETGGAVRDGLRALLLGELRARRADQNRSLHAPVHRFLESGGHAPQHSIAHVSFGTRPAQGGDFVDYSTRYGSIRGEDRITLLESLLESLGVYTGIVAQQHMRPDPLAPDDSDTASGVGLLKWPNKETQRKAKEDAHAALARIRKTAPLLHIDEALLQRPVVALSNGQTRRARILRALVSGAQLVVLDEPFTGLDPITRDDISRLFSEVHAARHPRLVLILREQDQVPSFITHALRIDDEGHIVHGNVHEVNTAPSMAYAPGSYERVRSNHTAGTGVGDAAQPPVVEMHDVSIEYGGVSVLNNISLTLRPGARLVLVGDNGSGKTTLLSLLLGDNPRSYALDASQLALFGAARDAPRNAHVLLQRRMGHLSPELFNAFPRRSLEAGGLTVEEAVASGFDGIFTRRRLTPERRARVHHLLRLFADVLVAHGQHSTGSVFDGIEALAESSFASLTHGSQALVLLLRAIVHRPEFVVLDEPFQGMSAKQSARAREFLDGGVVPTSDGFWLEGLSVEEQAQERAWRQQLVLVMVSHYQTEWLLSCGRLLRLQAGNAVEQL